jgi:hypothetical protein
MMAPNGQLQAALSAFFLSKGVFAGIYDDAPARASFPYLVIHCPADTAWNMQGLDGREIGIELTLWDEQPSRLVRLEHDLSVGREDVPPLEGWRLTSLVELGRQRTRNPAGPWSHTLKLRARVVNEGVGA